MKKIMFNDKHLLTQAVLRGEKTQTRRIVKDGTPLGYFEETMKYAPYKVGEVVAVAQCYLDIGSPQFDKFGRDVSGNTNKMFVKAELMPHKIKITSVRIERLQEISAEDCLREGLKFRYMNMGFGNAMTREDYYYKYINGYGDVLDYGTRYPKETFSILIDRIAGGGTWESNPYVWVYDFELVN